MKDAGVDNAQTDATAANERTTINPLEVARKNGTSEDDGEEPTDADGETEVSAAANSGKLGDSEILALDSEEEIVGTVAL